MWVRASPPIHLFYDCDKLTLLKKGLSGFWEELFGYSVELSLTLMILGYDGSLDLSVEEEYCLFLGTAVYRILLAARWKDTEPPTFHMWLARLLGIYNQERAIYVSRGRQARIRGQKVWAFIADWARNVRVV